LGHLAPTGHVVLWDPSALPGHLGREVLPGPRGRRFEHLMAPMDQRDLRYVVPLVLMARRFVGPLVLTARAHRLAPRGPRDLRQVLLAPTVPWDLPHLPVRLVPRDRWPSSVQKDHSAPRVRLGLLLMQVPRVPTDRQHRQVLAHREPLKRRLVPRGPGALRLDWLHLPVR
jgi:hypothetical protein